VPDRNSCGPASVTKVQTDLVGEPADQIERLHAEHSASEGFRAVIYDGYEAIVIVDPRTVGDWKKRVSEVHVAPSCVQEALISAAKEAVRE
jgi:hypothetical protein